MGQCLFLNICAESWELKKFFSKVPLVAMATPNFNLCFFGKIDPLNFCLTSEISEEPYMQIIP